MYFNAEEGETEEFNDDDILTVSDDDEVDAAQRPRNDEVIEADEALLRFSPPPPNRRHFFHSNPDPHIEHQITSLAQVCNLFPDQNLETIRNILDACNYDTETAVTRLNEIKRTNNMQASWDTSVPSFVPSDEQKAPKRKITSPGPETGPQMKQTKSLPESSGVEPKRHIPEEIESRIDTILDIFPQANDRAIRHRLEESADLDTVVAEVLHEMENGEKMEEGPGPSKPPEPTPPVKIDRKIEEHLSEEDKENLVHVTQIFPDVDPNFVFEQIAIHRKTLEDIVNKMTNDSNYPKLKQRLEKERQERRRQEFLNSEQFDIESYLHLFEEPDTYFNDQTRNTTDLYVRHAKVHLLNLFRNIREDFVQRQLRSHNNHFLPTYRTIFEGISQTGADGQRRKPRNFGMPVYNGELRPISEWPDEIDEMFFRELQYFEHQDEIREYMTERNRQRELREEEAEVNGQLIECQCCFNDNKLPEDMIACQQNFNHSFCRGCVRQHAETQVAQGFHRVSCMSDDCSAEYDIRILQNLLRPTSMDLLLRRRQQDEVRNAQLDNMESCPFCDFAMIIENPNEKVFKCQNPNCLRESCRQCKEPNHIPKCCDEVEKDAETRMRTYVENKMAEAWIRICPNCNNRIIKTSGCNALHCPCGTGICYVCNEVLSKDGRGYGHFDSGFAFLRGRNRDDTAAKRQSCPLHTGMNEVNADVAERAGKEARALYLKENPEAEEKAKIDDHHVEQLVDRDANNGRNGAEEMFRFLAGERRIQIGQRVRQRFDEHGQRRGAVVQFDVIHDDDPFEIVFDHDRGNHHQQEREMRRMAHYEQQQEREMRRMAHYERQQAYANRVRELGNHDQQQRAALNRAQEQENLNQQIVAAQQRVNEIYRRRQHLRQDLDVYERKVLRLEHMTQRVRHSRISSPENLNQPKSLRSIDHMQNNLEAFQRSRDGALNNLELSTVELDEANAELNRVTQLVQQEGLQNVAGALRNFGDTFEGGRRRALWRPQRERNQNLYDQRVMLGQLRRLHPQMIQVYFDVARQGTEDTDVQKQLLQFRNTQNNLLDQLNQHFMRDATNFNAETERDARQLYAEILKHLNAMRQFMSRAKSQSVTKNAEASSSAESSAAADGEDTEAKTDGIEGVQKKMKAICEALKALPENSPDETRKLKREALQNLREQLAEIKKKATRQEIKQTSNSAESSAAADGEEAEANTDSIEGVQKKMKAIFQALRALPENAPDEARNVKREALQNLREQLAEMKKKTTRLEVKHGETRKLGSLVMKRLAESAAATVAGKPESSGNTDKKMKYLKTLNERVCVLDNRLKDAQRRMNRGMPGGPSVKQLMQQRDDAISEQNGLEAALLRDGIEEEQLHRNDGRYELTHAENAEAIRLARNAVARREPPPQAIQRGIRIQFQQAGDQVPIVGGLQINAGVPIRAPIPVRMAVGRGIHVLHGNAARQRMRPGVRPGYHRVYPEFPPLHPQECGPLQIAGIQDMKNGRKGILKPLPRNISSSSASGKQEASSDVNYHSYGKTEGKQKALEARRQALIHAQEMQEEQMLNEHDRLNQESRAVQENIAELHQRERQIQDQMALSEQRLAQSREQHSRQIDQLNGQVHEMQIKSPIHSQETPPVSASGNEQQIEPQLQSVIEQHPQITSPALDERTIHPYRQRLYTENPARDGRMNNAHQLWANYDSDDSDDVPTEGQQIADELPAEQQLPVSPENVYNQWDSYSGASSDPPTRRQANLDKWFKPSGTRKEVPAKREILEAWPKYSEPVPSDPSTQERRNLDAWDNYFGNMGLNSRDNTPSGQTNPHGWNTRQAPTERAVSWYDPPVLSCSPVSSENGESSKSAEASRQSIPEGCRGRVNRVPWNLIKLDHGQSSSNKWSGTEEQTLPDEVPMEAEEPQSTVILVEEDTKMDSTDTDKADVQEDGNKKKRINTIVERVKESIPNVERQEVVNALLKVRECMGGNFGKQKLSELVRLVVSELKPVCSVIPNPRNSANLPNIAIPQSAPTVNETDITGQNQGTPALAQSDGAIGSAVGNLIPNIENQTTDSAGTSAESDDSTFTMRISRDGNVNINIQLPKTQSQQSGHSTRNSQEIQSDAQSESDQNITDVNLETKTDDGDVEFADFGNEKEI